VPRRRPTASASPRRAAADGRSRAACTSTGCSPRTTASARRRLDPLLSERTGTADTPYDSSRTGRRPTRCRRRHAPRVPRRLAARGHVPRGSRPRRGRRRRRHDRALQTAWQVRLLPNAATRAAPPTTTTSRLARRSRPSRRALTTDTSRGRADGRPVRAAAERRLPRPREPDLPRRGPRRRRAGTATFKWSRDNGSVAIPVVEMVSTTVLRLSTSARMTSSQSRRTTGSRFLDDTTS
jgi:hypothetical protein